jgi:hypothetical protein
MIGVRTEGNVPGATCLDSLLWFKNTPNQAILSELEEVYGKDVISLLALEESTAVFDSGCTELINLLRLGLVELGRSTLCVRADLIRKSHRCWESTTKLASVDCRMTSTCAR